MTKQDIQKTYTGQVAQLLNQGYTIFPDTMGGCQGEIAHIDLTSGSEILRVLLERGCAGGTTTMASKGMSSPSQSARLHRTHAFAETGTAPSGMKNGTCMDTVILEKKAERIYQILLWCGAERTQSGFCWQLVNEIVNLVFYNQSRVLFLDRAGKICDYRLFGANEWQWNDIMYYYENDLVFSKYPMKEPLHLLQKEKTVSSMLGHADAGFTLRTYTHVTTRMQEQAADTMGAFIAGRM